MMIMSNKEELEKLEEEIRLQELKIKKKELDEKLSSEDKKYTPPPQKNRDRTYWINRQPRFIRLPIQITFWLLVTIVIIMWINDFINEDNSSSSSTSPSTNSEISDTYRFEGCEGLDDLIAKGLFMSDSLAIMQIKSQINMMSDQQCQNLIDKNNQYLE